MKKLICVLLIGLTSLTTWAAGENLGLGVIIGDPTGVSLKYKLASDNAIDGALAWSSLGVHLHSNYLWQRDNYFNIDSQTFDLYYGIGLRLISINSGSNKNKTSIGPRAPLGANYKLRGTQLQFFAELALNLNLTPSSDVDFDGGIGMRFHF